MIDAMEIEISVDALQNYVENNEVVYQCGGELIEVSNDTEIENKNSLLGYFRMASRVKVYDRCDEFIRYGWQDLADWSTDNDYLFLLDSIGVLLCIPKKEVEQMNLIVK